MSEKVYDVVESNEAYTIYQPVEIEDCSDNFISGEEFQELNGVRYNLYEWDTPQRNYKYMIVNTSWLTATVAEAKKLFDERDPKRVTVPFTLSYNHEYLTAAFRDKLDQVGLKFISGRIRAAKPKQTFNKLSVITTCIDIGIYIIERKWNLKIRIDRPSNAAKTQIVKLLYSNGVTFDHIIKQDLSVNYYWSQHIEKEEAVTFAREWWKEQLEKELTSTEQ